MRLATMATLMMMMMMMMMMMQGLVVHDRIGETPQELDLKRGQYVFLTSRVFVIIIINIIIVIIIIIDIITISSSMIVQVNPEWYHGDTCGGRQGLIAASFVRILPQHVSLCFLHRMSIVALAC